MQLQIKGIECMALIGCNHRERQLKQVVTVDVLLEFANEPQIDDINATVNYSTVCSLIRQWVEASNFMLLEALAQDLSAKLLDQFSLVQRVNLCLGKPQIFGQKARKILVKHSKCRQYKVALALGSNLNNPSQQLITAIEFLSAIISDLRIAPFYRSTPYGYAEQEDFYNTCISGLCSLSPLALLRKTKSIEKLMGKQELFVNGPRVIDIDIIFYANQVYHELFLQIPHPQSHLRDFVLLPLAQIEPQWRHPQYNSTVLELLANCDQHNVLHQVS
jgi:dihydroneopterin aldolase/2-amino-4-hydroxy-6-hydroxymethyldihydropteridine diphosphokinase